jgi:hypothetical protein
MTSPTNGWIGGDALLYYSSGKWQLARAFGFGAQP